MTDFIFTSVDTEALGESRRWIDDRIRDLDSALKILHNEVLPTLQACWEGEAKNRFEQRFLAFEAELKEWLQAQRSLNRQLLLAESTYERADAVARNATQSIPLGG
ncbi:MAG: WXG100 family type VII secretion target [Bacillota bacterium]|nr:WXG100 family type VII secretion target [Bacillota bacterium]